MITITQSDRDESWRALEMTTLPDGSIVRNEGIIPASPVSDISPAFEAATKPLSNLASQS